MVPGGVLPGGTGASTPCSAEVRRGPSSPLAWPGPARPAAQSPAADSPVPPGFCQPRRRCCCPLPSAAPPRGTAGLGASRGRTDPTAQIRGRDPAKPRYEAPGKKRPSWGPWPWPPWLPSRLTGGEGKREGKTWWLCCPSGAALKSGGSQRSPPSLAPARARCGWHPSGAGPAPRRGGCSGLADTEKMLIKRVGCGELPKHLTIPAATRLCFVSSAPRR